MKKSVDVQNVFRARKIICGRPWKSAKELKKFMSSLTLLLFFHQHVLVWSDLAP